MTDHELAALFPRFSPVLEPRGKARAAAREFARAQGEHPGPWREAWRSRRSGSVELVGAVCNALRRAGDGSPVRADAALLAQVLSPAEFALASSLVEAAVEERQRQAAGHRARLEQRQRPRFGPSPGVLDGRGPSPGVEDEGPP